MTTTESNERTPRADAPLEGHAALGLYVTELGRNVAAITEQSVLLLKALSERVTLMREMEMGKSQAQPRTSEQASASDVTPPASLGPLPGPKP